jgi:hypothetical protein
MQQAIYSDNQSFTDFIPFLGRLTVYNLSMFSLVKSCEQILSFVVLNCITCISRNYYSPGSASLYFGGRSLGVRPMEVVLDSGSSYTYFSAQPYQALVTAVNFRNISILK